MLHSSFECGGSSHSQHPTQPSARLVLTGSGCFSARFVLRLLSLLNLLLQCRSLCSCYSFSHDGHPVSASKRPSISSWRLRDLFLRLRLIAKPSSKPFATISPPVGVLDEVLLRCVDLRIKESVDLDLTGVWVQPEHNARHVVLHVALLISSQHAGEVLELRP